MLFASNFQSNILKVDWVPKMRLCVVEIFITECVKLKVFPGDNIFAAQNRYLEFEAFAELLIDIIDLLLVFLFQCAHFPEIFRFQINHFTGIFVIQFGHLADELIDILLEQWLHETMSTFLGCCHLSGWSCSDRVYLRHDVLAQWLRKGFSSSWDIWC